MLQRLKDRVVQSEHIGHKTGGSRGFLQTRHTEHSREREGEKENDQPSNYQIIMKGPLP